MHSRRKYFKAFAERNLQEYFRENNLNIQSHIEQESENYILNPNEIEYINYLVSEFTIETPNIDFESVFVSNYEKHFPANPFHDGFGRLIHPIKDYLGQLIIYHLPCTGDVNTLQFAPNYCLNWTIEVFIEEQCLCFEVVDIRKITGETKLESEIKFEAQNIVNCLKKQIEYLTQNITSYHTTLRMNIEQAFKARKQKLLNKNKMLASLGVPIKKREELPQTYAIPTLQIRKSIAIKPNVTASEYRPEPALDQSTYHNILLTIHDVGKIFERLPSTYSGKGEEDLRDHFLLYLEPRFEGSATGETFNKSGKTDLLIRHLNSNVFITECKFWSGQKNYLATITQLLGYLTWRDSKAAVVVFVKNKEFSSVLQVVEQETPNHSNYLGFVNKEDESWFNYRFHINHDHNREVKLAVLLFHIP